MHSKTSDTNAAKLTADFSEQTEELLQHAANVIARLLKAGKTITTVESCTGGALAHYLTCISGSSDVLKDAFVTYSNEAKIALGVPKDTIEQHTVYSLETAVAMARAGLQRSVSADVAVGITGSLSRVDPTNDNSVPGEVYIAIATIDKTITQKLTIPEPHRLEAKSHIVLLTLQQLELSL